MPEDRVKSRPDGPPPIDTLHASIPPERAGQRLDQALGGLFPQFSRTRLQRWVREGQVLVDGRTWRVRDRVGGGERIELRPETVAETAWRAQDLPLRLVYEDEHLIVVDKPAGLVVHPGAGNPDGTLVNALLHHAPELQELPRAGIVHRIDKDTSGLLVVARSLVAHTGLVRDLKAHAIAREYRALVSGVLTAGGRVEAPIGRHPRQRLRMAVVSGGRPAVSHYRVAERFAAHTLLQVRLETGRTHQIRVHMAHIRHPVVGDPLYAGRPRLPPECGPGLAERLQTFRRQALHAYRLALHHPVSGHLLTWESPLPCDMVELMLALRGEAGGPR